MLTRAARSGFRADAFVLRAMRISGEIVEH